MLTFVVKCRHPPIRHPPKRRLHAASSGPPSAHALHALLRRLCAGTSHTFFGFALAAAIAAKYLLYNA